ncbi:MAG TPA: hypothetical protein VJU87_01040 [Gemmatimonadaceae bacterium]|nr:hypothetical protein [Gemmatimonadaceae bacterium]
MAVERPTDHSHLARWPGLLSLSLGVLLGPVMVLVNQEAIYAANMNQGSCPADTPLAMHLIPLVCLVVTLGAGGLAYREWDRVGRGIEDSQATVHGRSRFLGLLGMWISALSALLILTQWLAIFVFNPCLRG